MRKLLFTLSALALSLSPLAVAEAAVTASASSLAVSPMTLKASSAATGLFAVTLAQTAAETLSSVAITITNSGASTASGSDFASVAVYKDNGNGTFDPATDAVAGTQATVSVGSATTVTTASNNTIDGGKFFVALSTSGTWSSAASPVDSVTATLAANGVVTSANSPTLTAVTTAAITADTVGPVLSTAVATNAGGGTAKNAGDTVVLTFGEATNKPVITAANIASLLQLNNSHSFLDGVASIGGASWNAPGTVLTITLSAGTLLPTVELGDTVTVAGTAITDSHGNLASGNQVITGTFGADTTAPALSSAVAKNTGGTSAKEAGDSVELTFSEATNKFVITAANIASLLQLNNSHSFLDGASSLGSATWSADGIKLTITLSAGTSVPTITVGDTVTVAGTSIKDAANNNATGTVNITGDFGGTITTPPPGDDDDDSDEDSRKHCASGVVNGRLYKIKGSATVYLAAGCRLKPFRGAAVFKARGHKFQNIVELDALPSGAVISDKPALPAVGTLIRGSKEKTVWFIGEDGKKHGFTREDIFRKLGFRFEAVEVIEQSDADTMEGGDNVDNDKKHPKGAIVQCTGAKVVFKVDGNIKHPFTSAEAFNARGHQFKHILSVDCTNFTYADGTAIQ